MAALLTIRPWRVEDAPALDRAVRQSLEHLRPWMKWVADEPLPLPERQALIRRWEDDAVAGADEVLGVFRDDEVVGGTGLHHRLGPGGLEIGYWVHVAHTGRGYATAVAAALTVEALRRPGISRVEIHHDVANRASAQIPFRLGYRSMGDIAHEPEAPGETGVRHVWRLTADELARGAVTLDPGPAGWPVLTTVGPVVPAAPRRPPR